MKNIEVTVIGSLNFDIIMKQQRLPRIGETYTADSVTTSPGGKGANQAVQASKLGLNTYMLGMVGQDVFADSLMDALKEYNVNHQYVHQGNNMTGMGVVNSLPNGELVATISQGANYDIDRSFIDQHVDLIKRSKVIILQLEIPVEVVAYIIEIAKQHDCYIILNAAPSLPLPRETMKLIDCLVVNEEEASFYSNHEVTNVEQAISSCKKLYSQTGGLIVVTVGSKGSIIFDGKEIRTFEPHPTQVVETTGAGDSYVGAIAYGIINSYSIEELGIFASKVSAITIQNIGAQNSMPYLDQVMGIS